MKAIKKILYFYSLFFTLSLFIQGLRMMRTTTDLALIILLSAPTIFFVLSLIQLFNRRVFSFNRLREIAFYLKIISLVNSLFLAFIALIGLLFYFQYLFVFVFLPLPLYFFLSDFDKEIREEMDRVVEGQMMLNRQEGLKKTEKNEGISQSPGVDLRLLKKDLGKEGEAIKQVKDPLRRQFLKTIGVSGVGFFIAALLNPKKTEAAFFGSIPGPGTVALKNTSGQRIDPAEKKPTDGYVISEIDDSSPAYYGYLDKNGDWYIIKENTDGSFRYVKGSENFSSYWNNRSTLVYDYFNNVF